MSNSRKKSQKKSQTKRPVQPQQRSLLPWLVVGGIALLAVAGIVFLLNRPASGQQTTAPATVTGGPALEVDRDQIDFGDVPLGKTVRASFKLSNVGDKPLTLSYPPVAQVVEGC